MAIVVKRPKLSLWEHLYLPGLVKGLRITMRHFWHTLRGKGRVTMQYPEETWNAHLPEHYRGEDQRTQMKNRIKKITLPKKTPI